jgi:uncharacterized protein (TIGR02646 family)
MRPCTRSPAPEVLAREGAAIGRNYAARRRANPSHRFQWRQSLLQAVRAELGRMTAEHCSYCDGYPIDGTGEETIDHFRPKGRPEFHELVCEWTNLFLACSACNNAKQDQWDEALLRPDDPDFRFERYFEYHHESGRLQPSAAASPDDQARARRTIEIFDLNRRGACANRRRTVEWIRRISAEVDGYRFLIPLCQLAE